MMSMADEILSVKSVAESTIDSNTIPSTFIAFHLQTSITVAEEEEEPIPVIDVSLLTSHHPNQRSKVVNDIRNACTDWGIFTVPNYL